MYAKLIFKNAKRSVNVLWILFSGKSLLQCDTPRTHPFRCTEENDADCSTIGGTSCSIFDVLC